MTGIIIKSGVIDPQRYKVAMPLDTHWRPATCEEVDCEAFLKGFSSIVVAPSEDEINNIIRAVQKTGRSFSVERVDGGARLRFPPGQNCPKEHKTQLEREALYIHGIRGQRASLREVSQPEWHERFDENLHALKELKGGING